MSKSTHSLAVVAVTVMMVAFTGISVWADSESYGNYAKICTGATLFTDDLDNAGFDAGGNGSLTYGRYLFKHLVVEGSIGAFITGEKFEGNTVITGDYTRKDTIYVTTILATVKGEWPIGPVRLFAGGGVGGYLLALKSRMDTDNLGDFRSDHTDSVFGVHGVIGGYFNITERLFAGMQGMYYQTNDINIDKQAITVPVSYTGNLNGYTVSVSCGFRF